LEVDVQQSNFKILQLLPQVLLLFLVKKWIPPTRSDTAEIGQKNRRNFRGYILIFYFFGKLIFPTMSKTPKFGEKSTRKFRG
jgi:hypothetical protein